MVEFDIERHQRTTKRLMNIVWPVKSFQVLEYVKLNQLLIPRCPTNQTMFYPVAASRIISEVDWILLLEGKFSVLSECTYSLTASGGGRGSVLAFFLLLLVSPPVVLVLSAPESTEAETINTKYLLYMQLLNYIEDQLGYVTNCSGKSLLCMNR